MTVGLEQVQSGVINFVEKEIASKAVGIKKFGIYFIMPAIKKSTYNYLIKLKEFMPDLFNDDGNIELDKFYNIAKDAIRRSGQFEYMGIIFNESDIDSLYSYIKQAGVGNLVA